MWLARDEMSSGKASLFPRTDHDLPRVVQAKDRLQAVADYWQGDAFLFFHSPNRSEDSILLLNRLGLLHTCYYC